MKSRFYLISTISAILVMSLILLLSNVSGFNKEVVEKTRLTLKYNFEKSIFIKKADYLNSFEGKIEIIEKRAFDTILFLVTVKQSTVKLDKNIINGISEESLIFDLENESIIALHHNKKMFCNIQISSSNKSSSSDFKIIKTNNTKTISGYTCNQWRVKNIVENTEITFWVTGKRFDFYQKFVQLWNKTDNCYQYFLAIPESDGYIPMQQVERNLMRDIKNSILVTKITEQKIDGSQFEIPKDYSLYSN